MSAPRKYSTWTTSHSQRIATPHTYPHTGDGIDANTCEYELIMLNIKIAENTLAMFASTELIWNSNLLTVLRTIFRKCVAPHIHHMRLHGTHTRCRKILRNFFSSFACRNVLRPLRPGSSRPLSPNSTRCAETERCERAIASLGTHSRASDAIRKATAEMKNLKWKCLPLRWQPVWYVLLGIACIASLIASNWCAYWLNWWCVNFQPKKFI